MEPKLPSSHRAPEIRPAAPAPYPEAVSSYGHHEINNGQAVEQREHHNSPAALTGETVASALVLPAPTIPSPSGGGAVVAASVQNDDTPTLAGDEELIEKEWVEKAKRVVAETKDDPYRREQEVNKLQADYLFKRYGRKLGSPQ